MATLCSPDPDPAVEGLQDALFAVKQEELVLTSLGSDWRKNSLCENT